MLLIKRVKHTNISAKLCDTLLRVCLIGFAPYGDSSTSRTMGRTTRKLASSHPRIFACICSQQCYRYPFACDDDMLTFVIKKGIALFADDGIGSPQAQSMRRKNQVNGRTSWLWLLRFSQIERFGPSSKLCRVVAWRPRFEKQGKNRQKPSAPVRIALLDYYY